MVAVLTVSSEERPTLMFELERLIPVLQRETREDRDTAAHLAYVLRGLEQAPPGSGEIELEIQDIFALGTRNFAVGVDLEEYWLDLRELAEGWPAAEKHDPEVTIPAGKYFPEMAADPKSWKFVAVEPFFSDLGFQYDRLITEQAPRARALYNKTRNPITGKAIERRRLNAAARLPNSETAYRHPDLAQLPQVAAAAGAHEEPVTRPRPSGTALAPVGAPAAGLTVISRATYPEQYDWGVDVGTNVDADDLEPNKPVRVNVGGAELILVNTDGKVCAAQRQCPHRGWDLSRGSVAGGVLTCPLHGAQFEVCSGEVVREPYSPEFNREHPLLSGTSAVLDPKKTTEPLETYPTRVADDGEVFVHI